jgi:hypothetical protein
MRRRSYLGAAIVVLGLVMSGGAAQAIAPTWKLQTTRNPPGATSSLLNGVSCPTARTCEAVGTYTDAGGHTATLAERWHHRRWEIQSTPDPVGATSSVLNGVSCRRGKACEAVGSYVDAGGATLALAEHWNGRRWEIQTIPSPGGATSSVLNGVSCSAANACTAVGSYINGTDTLTLADRWNGTSWTAQSTPNETGTFGGPAPNVLTGVSCPASSACTAVGSFTDIDVNSDVCPVTMGWNGTTWQPQGGVCPGTNPQLMMGPDAILAGVSCTAASACTAVGRYLNFGDELLLAARWDGTSWTMQATPDPSSGTLVPESNLFNGTSCATVSACTAVGTFADVNGQLTLAEHWNGVSWEIQPTIDPQASPVFANVLNGVSCPARRLCTAVGSYIDSSSGDTVTLAERYSG